MEYTVLADNGVVEYSSAGSPATVFWKDETQDPLPAPEVDPFAEEIRYFVECCQTGQQPARCPPRESALAVWTTLTMAQAREKKGDKVECEFRKNWKSV
jgi:hypothetical protein